MSEMSALIAATAARVMEAADPAAMEFDAGAWSALAESGLLETSVAEGLGGGGLPLSESAVTVRLAAYRCAFIPIAETVAAKWLLAKCGQTATSTAPMTVAYGAPLTLEKTSGGHRATGRLEGVAWITGAGETIAMGSRDGHNLLLRLNGPFQPDGERRNLAGEPRISITLDDIVVPGDCVWAFPDDGDLPLIYMAALRSVQLSGAMQRALETAIAYANDRVQFGRPIGRFQAVQQKLAEAAGNFAAGLAASNEALVALDDPDPARRVISVAAAKSRCAAAATHVAAVTHQVMGAIGFTREHDLHLATRRLWSWREEAGDEDYWNARLGRLVRDLGPARSWDLMGRVGEAADTGGI